MQQLDTQLAPSIKTPKVIWEPLEGSQALAMGCPCDHILYEGTRGPGKTDAQLMYFRQFVGMGYGQFWRGIIFDKSYKNLDDIITKSRRWFTQFGDGAKFKASGAPRWVWPSGEELLFRHIERPSDYYLYHGHEYAYLGWNELTKHANSDLYDAMMSTNRSSFVPIRHSKTLTDEDHEILAEHNYDLIQVGSAKGVDVALAIKKRVLPPIPLVVFSTTNPHGVGHNWVKRRFISPAPPGHVLRKTVEVFNPRTQQRENVTRTQVRIFGSYKENIYLTPEYVAELESITEPNKRRAWLFGDWDITSGGAVDDLWRADLHICPRFKIPESWHIDRSFDWGSSHPFSVGYWAEANGEECEVNGHKWAPPPGTLFRIDEIYGCRRDEHGALTNEGLKMGPKRVAELVRERDEWLVSSGWVPHKPHPGPADNQIRNVMDGESDTIEKKMADEGVIWTTSDKSPGSRKNGLQLFRDRLEAGLRGEGPAIYIFDNCRAACELLPVLPRSEKDPDDVDTDSWDHSWDETRYRILKSNNRAATTITVETVY